MGSNDYKIILKLRGPSIELQSLAINKKKEDSMLTDYNADCI